MAKTRFHALLEQKIAEAIENRSISVASGVCTEYANYRENVGYIKGLQAALALCDEIESELDA